MMLKAFLLVGVHMAALARGAQNNFGSIAIENPSEPNINDDIIRVVFDNDCNEQSVEARTDIILEHMSCLSSMDSVTTDTLSGVYLDSSDDSCIDDTSIDLSNLCIVGVSYDDFVESQTCVTRSVSDAALPGGYSWALDKMDGTTDSTYTYWANPLSADLYIIDTGIRRTHDEFTTGLSPSAVVNIQIYPGMPDYWNLPTHRWYNHGTVVASAAGGYHYGAARQQVIYNLNTGYPTTDGDGDPIVTNSGCYIEMALARIRDRLALPTTRRGVINMSFAGNNPSASTVMLRDALHLQILLLGGILVAAAGNSAVDLGTDGCAYPARSPFVIAVGSHTSTFADATSSQYGDCIDVWGPGNAVRVGTASDDDAYSFASGTSLASPYVAGVIANYLAECDETNYHEPCTFTNIKRRLEDPHQTIFDTTKCEPSFDCSGLLYQCDNPMFPRPVYECTNPAGYCSSGEAGDCRIYHSPPGCDQCEPGTFKKSYDHPCEDCQEIFGNACIGCNDYSGCCQCSPINDFTLTKDDESGLWYCKPSPCLNPENNCQVCNNGVCCQCVWPYTLDADRMSCS